MGLELELGAVQGDGATLREHLVRLWRSTRRVDPKLAEARKPLPASVAYLWGWFRDLADGRAPDTPISVLEVEGWQRMTGVRLTPWEFDTLRAMDRVWLGGVTQQLRKQPA